MKTLSIVITAIATVVRISGNQVGHSNAIKQEWWESTGKPVSELKKQGATKATL